MPDHRTTTLRLGLIGDNIAASQAPRLHRAAGAQAGIAVTYDLLVPPDRGQSFDAVFDAAATAGYRGLNITYPYKEQVVSRVRIDDPVLRSVGAINTVIFEKGGPQGFNTDFTGFKAAYKGTRGDVSPGDTLIIGSGGVGRAIAFGLADLGATALRLVDRDAAKSEGLARDLRGVFPDLAIDIRGTAEDAARGATGIVNATPVGMVGYDGTPLDARAMAGAAWAFDAVYTPRDTVFLCDAQAQGLTVVSGYELFFFQGLHAWAHFSGSEARPSDLRRALSEGGGA